MTDTLAKTLDGLAKRHLSVKLEYRPQSGKWSASVEKSGQTSALRASAEDASLDEVIHQITRMIGVSP